MFEATQDGLGKNAPVHSIHGSLLAVGELLRLIEFSTFCLVNVDMQNFYNIFNLAFWSNCVCFTFRECY